MMANHRREVQDSCIAHRKLMQLIFTRIIRLFLPQNAVVSVTRVAVVRQQGVSTDRKGGISLTTEPLLTCGLQTQA